ncbi:MAG: alpha/beta hydrolase [Halobacteriaceae archaeon]
MAAELHPQARALLEDIDDQGSLPAHALSVAATRAEFEQSFAPPEERRPVGGVRDLELLGPADRLPDAGGIPVRLYTPEAETGGKDGHPVVVFAHGGGWVRGSLDTHDDVCRALTAAAGVAVLAVDYHRPPEYPFPHAVEDVYAALEWVAEFGPTLGLDAGRLAVAGDSAGGNLAAGAALLARDRGGPELAAQVLCYPVLDARMDTDSYHAYAEGYIPSRAAMEFYWEQYLARPADAANPYAAPARVRDPAGLPPTTIVAAECDPLYDEGVAYAAHLRGHGVPVDHSTYEGITHGFLSFPGYFDAAADARGEIADALGTAFE